LSDNLLDNKPTMCYLFVDVSDIYQNRQCREAAFRVGGQEVGDDAYYLLSHDIITETNGE